MKKWLCLALSLLMLAVFLPALAESDEWNYDSDYCILRGYSGAGGDVVVPAEIDGGTVDVIDVNVFSSETITGLSLPETLLELRSNAISWCENLTSVSLPQSLVVINRMNFGSCNALSEITIPAGVRYIGDSSFKFCESLRKITFEGMCPVIDANCFTVLPEDAVAYVPDDQLEAYTAAFEKAGSEISVQPSGKNAVVVENNGYAEEDFDFDPATGTITSYNGYATYLAIPETIGGAAVKAIGTEAFAYHCYLALLELPEGLETIGDGAFYGCETLGHVEFPSTLKSIGDNAFYNAYGGSTLELTGVESIGAHAFYFAGLTGDMELPEGLKTIGEGAFESCGSLGDLYLPSTLESIGSNAFKGDYNIQYVVVNSLTPPALGEGVFAGCDYLEDIDLYAHDTKQQMQEWQAYVDALGLSCRVWRAQDPTTISPESGSYKYENFMLTEYTGTAPRLRAHLTVDDASVTGLGDGVFKGNQTIEYFSVAHNDEFTTIGAEAFMNSSLKEVDLFDSVTTIGARAFAGCAQLEELTLPDSVTEIGEGALDGLTGLKKLVIKCDPAIIPAGAFANLSALTDVTVETGAIPAHMFEGSGVTSLTLGAGVTEIGESAFANTALTSVDLKNVTSIGAEAFKETALTSVDLAQVVSIGESAFEGAALESVALNAAADVGERAFANTNLTQIAIPAGGSFPLSAVEGTNAELRLSADATDEQVDAWNEALNRPWYDPLPREGEDSRFVKMPFEPTPSESFEFDPETGLISAYTGTDVDVVVPREIDGVTVVGFANYNVFESCRDYTDTDMETNQTDWVHLRTLVLPETIKELPDSLMSYCQQLETFICYAPLETTGGTQFMLCRSLDTVIFVNGVRAIENYAFDNAGSLSTLYFGEHLDRIGQQAFGYSGLTSFVADAEIIESNAFVECKNLTSLHLTGKVKSCGEYMVSDCPNLTEICFDGCDLTTSEMELVYNVASQLTVHVPEDMDEENLNCAENCVAWNSSEVAVSVTTAPCAHTLPERPDVYALLPDLKSEAGAEVAAAAAESATAPESAPEPISEAETTPEAQTAAIPEEYLGTWYCVSMEEDGTVYPLAEMGMEMVFTIRADGTATLDVDGETDTAECAMQDGVLVIDGVAVTLENGALIVSEDGVVMTLMREKPETGVEIAEISEPAGASDEGAEIMIGTKYVMTDADVDGYNMPAEQFGGYEYSILLREDGTAAFVIAGADVPGLTWAYGRISTETGEVDGVIIDYYTQPLSLVPTEKEFDVDYFGSMLMHFAPETSAQ